MAETTIKIFFARHVTVAHADGHEFIFEAVATNTVIPSKLFAERWKNKRLPLNANACRQAARIVAEQRFRERGLI